MRKSLFQQKVVILAKLMEVLVVVGVVEGLQELFKDQESVDITVAAVDDLIIIDIEKSV